MRFGKILVLACATATLAGCSLLPGSAARKAEAKTEAATAKRNAADAAREAALPPVAGITQVDNSNGTSAIILDIKSFWGDDMMVRTAGDRLQEALVAFKEGNLGLPPTTKKLTFTIRAVPEAEASPAPFLHADFDAAAVRAVDLTKVSDVSVFGLASKVEPAAGHPVEVVRDFCHNDARIAAAGALCR